MTSDNLIQRLRARAKNVGWVNSKMALEAADALAAAQEENERLEARLANAEAQFWKQMERAEKAEARVAELGGLIERKYFTGWNDAIRAAASLVHGAQWEGIDEPNDPTGRSHNSACRGFAEAIRTLLRKEGGSDDQ